MAKTAKYAVETDMGCGFFASVLHLRGFRPRNSVLFEDNPHSSKSAKPQPVKSKITPSKPIVRTPNAARKSTSSSNNSGSNKSSSAAFTSSDLSLTISDQKPSDSNGTRDRASKGNVMLWGHLGNVIKPRSKIVVVNGITARKKEVETGHRFGNIIRGPINRLSADVIKSMGNDKYKEGKYEEALALYNESISIDPNKACYYSNKSAALMGLGRLVEAVLQCREAVRIDSSYHNAHFRLAKLYLRLGEAEKAVHHYKCAGHKAVPDDISRAEDLKKCLDTCIDARSRGEWSKVLNESETALSLGSHSAPQIYAMKAEALMGLHRHEDAHTVIQNAPHFNMELYAGLLGSSVTAAAGVLEVHALVYIANGRFEDADAVAQQALKLNSCNRIKLTAERIRHVALARLNGNRLFKGSRFSEAMYSYNEGLEKDPHNSVLLCNRAACRYNQGQYEKAVEDCTAALLLRPSYAKARLRRAGSNAKLEKWGAAIQDYEVVMQENDGDGDGEVGAALLEARKKLNQMQSGYSTSLASSLHTPETGSSRNLLTTGLVTVDH